MRFWDENKSFQGPTPVSTPGAIPICLHLQAKRSVWPVSLELSMVRTEELFIRGAELAVFSCVMRTHEGESLRSQWLRRDAECIRLLRSGRPRPMHIKW